MRAPSIVRWAVVLLCGSAARAESVVTTRVGEQDTCDLTGVTTLAWDGKAGLSHIRFDLAKLPRDTQVAKALLRFWVDATSPHGPAYRAWGYARWDDARFDGFKVWDGAEPARDRLLDTRYPFNTPTFWCPEFDVTRAVQRWAAHPASNQGLSTSFQFPTGLGSKPEVAWQRPYLQITYAGANPNRPKPPSELKAFFRSGQVFLTWKQAPRDGAFFDSTYRVYRHTEPITTATLDRAEQLGEVHRLSQLNYRRTMTARGGDYGPWKHYISAAGHEPYPEGESREQRMARVLPLIPERFNFVIDDAWREREEVRAVFVKPRSSGRVQIHQGPQLPDDTGLFVHTVRQEGRAWLAVTSVLEGNENREEIATVGPIEAKVEKPQAVLQAVFTANGPEGYGKIGRFQIREYVYWEGGTTDSPTGGPRPGAAPAGRVRSFHPEPSTPFCFTFHYPRRFVGLGYEHNEDKSLPPWTCSLAKVAGYSVSYWDGRGVVMDTGYVPPTRLAPFPPGGAPNMSWAGYGRFYYGSRRPPQGPARGPSHCVRDVYGYMETINSGADPRQATVQPYFENRRLFELDFALGHSPADGDYVWASGEGSTLNFAIHHAERIGCAETAQEKPWTSPRGAEGKDVLVGRREWALKNEQGVSVWDWNDPVWHAKRSPGRAWPFISNCHSDNYDGADNWAAVGFPRFYLDLAALKQGAELWWCDIGDAPNGRFQRVPRYMAYPLLTNVTCCEKPLANWRDEPRGTLNGYVVWCRPTQPWLYVRDLTKEKEPPKPPPGRSIPYAVRPWGGTIYWGAVPADLVNTDERFEMTLRIGEHGLMLNGQSVPPCRVAFGAADVTPRRLRLVVDKDWKYLWRNVRVATGQVLQAGVIEPDEHRLLTVPGFLVDKDIRGNKLVIERLDGKPVPKVDRSQPIQVVWFRTPGDRHHDQNAQVEELPYKEYVQRCLKPELVPVVRPDKVFHIADFLNARGFRGDGLYSMWGGGFEDAYEFPQGGRYRVEVETTKSYLQNGAWPILGLFVDAKPVGERLLDSEEPIVRTWWVDLPKGRHLVRFWLMNNVFNEPGPRHGDQSPKPDRGFTLLGVRFVRLEERPETVTAVHELRIRQRSVVTCVGLPIRVRADWLCPWGLTPLRGKLIWRTTEGATITADGIFMATQPGTCTVTASAGGKSDSVKVVVQGDAWVEDFDDAWADGWLPVQMSQKPGDASQWLVTRHHGFVGALVQRTLRGPAAHLILWEGGIEWEDVSIQADCPLEGEALPRGKALGLLFRCQDARSHYRFEKRGQELRLVKLIGGEETVLARATKGIPPLTVKRSDYPSFHHWSDRYRDDPKPFPIDRLQVELRGDRVVARFNGQEVFDVRDAALRAGTIGLWCQGGAAFDNVVVRPLR